MNYYGEKQISKLKLIWHCWTLLCRKSLYKTQQCYNHPLKQLEYPFAIAGMEACWPFFSIKRLSWSPHIAIPPSKSLKFILIPWQPSFLVVRSKLESAEQLGFPRWQVKGRLMFSYIVIYIKALIKPCTGQNVNIY